MQRPPVSAKTIILKISRDLNLGSLEIPWQDMLEWVGEGLQHIGAIGQLDERLATIPIANFQGYLPEDYHSARPSTLSYKLVGNTIQTAFCTGFLDFPYLAFMVDDEGFPLVPDNISYSTALFWKVAMQLSIRDQLPNKQLSYQVCKGRWDWYCRQAGTQGQIGDSSFFGRYASIATSPIPFVGVPTSVANQHLTNPTPDYFPPLIPQQPIAKPQI